MARPQKEGLDYFALDVKMDDETELIEAKHGIEGFAIMIKIFQKIYSQGYYLEWTERQQLLFSNKVSSDLNKVIDVINDCLKWGIFNKTLYEEYGILTSRRIQSHYISAAYKRSKIALIEEYLLVDIGDRNNIELIGVSDNGNEETTDINDGKNQDVSNISDINSTQSKVKKSKVKKSKYKYAEFVSMTEEEYQKLLDKHGEFLTKRMIQVLDNYKGAKGKTYKSDYRAILNWVEGKVLQEYPGKKKDDVLELNTSY